MVLRLVLAFLLLPLLGAAQVIQFTSSKNPTRVNEQAMWLEDSSARYTGPELLQNPKGFPFFKAKGVEEFFNRQNIPVFSYFQLQNRTSENVFLLVDNSNIDQVDVWYTYGGSVRHVAAGVLAKQRHHIFTSNKVILRIATDGSVQQVVLRARNARKLILPIYLASPAGLHHFLSVHNGLDILMLGMVLMLLLYNLFMVAQTKSRSQAWYILYLISLIGYAFFYIRGMRHFLPEPAFQLFHRYSYTWGSLCYLFALQFVQAYLRNKPLPQKFRNFFRYLIILPLANIFCDLFSWYEAAYLLSVVLAFFTPAFMLAIGILAYRKGDKSILFFLLGWTSVSLCTIANTLLVLEIIPPTLKYIPQLLLAGTCLEMLFLSSGLGFRFSKTQKEKLALQQQLVGLLNNQKADLEVQVADRTKALANALRLMEESDALKARLLAIISHDLRMPFVSLNASLDLLTLNILTPEKAQQKLINVRSNIRHIAGTLENLLTWSKHQQQRIQTISEPLSVELLARNVASLLETTLTSKNLDCQLEIAPGTQVLADRFQLEAILRNLLSNAIKASNPHTALGIRCVAEADGMMYRITVFDSGQGLQEGNLDAWLKHTNPFANGSSLLSGLGLQICREFLANHHSELGYNHNGQGSEFSFLLPAAPPKGVSSMLNEDATASH